MASQAKTGHVRMLSMTRAQSIVNVMRPRGASQSHDDCEMNPGPAVRGLFFGTRRHEVFQRVPQRHEDLLDMRTRRAIRVFLIPDP